MQSHAPPPSNLLKQNAAQRFNLEKQEKRKKRKKCFLFLSFFGRWTWGQQGLACKKGASPRCAGVVLICSFFWDRLVGGVPGSNCWTREPRGQRHPDSLQVRPRPVMGPSRPLWRCMIRSYFAFMFSPGSRCWANQFSSVWNWLCGGFIDDGWTTRLQPKQKFSFCVQQFFAILRQIHPSLQVVFTLYVFCLFCLSLFVWRCSTFFDLV